METAKVFIGGYVAKELKDELQELAAAEERSVNYLMIKILTSGVNHRLKKILARKGRSLPQAR